MSIEFYVEMQNFIHAKPFTIKPRKPKRYLDLDKWYNSYTKVWSNLRHLPYQYSFKDNLSPDITLVLSISYIGVDR